MSRFNHWMAVTMMLLSSMLMINLKITYAYVSSSLVENETTPLLKTEFPDGQVVSVYIGVVSTGKTTICKGNKWDGKFDV